MNVTYTKEIVVHLAMNYEEASWLRDVMQNYMGGIEETKEHADMRRLFFDSVNSALKKGA